MENKTQIVMIAAEQLQHHPDNPRKTIKDLEELAASIKANGIMQNLTVVPVPDNENEYYIVIGNRRFEAGKIAGISHYPCVISNMDYGKQLETMLIENMQRSDLTIIEQAEGFEQLTLNGFSVEDIVKKTGFSQATVYRRLQVAKLDKNAVAKAYDRGVTLDEFVKVSELDEDLRTSVMNSIGTNNFNWEHSKAKKKMCARKHIVKLEPIVNSYATKVDTRPEGYLYEQDIHLMQTKCPDVEIPKDGKKRCYRVDISDYFFDITIYVEDDKKDTTNDSKAQDTILESIKARHKALEDLITALNERVKLFLADALCRTEYKEINLIGYKHITNCIMNGSFGFKVEAWNIVKLYKDVFCDGRKNKTEISRQIEEIVQGEYEYYPDMFPDIQRIAKGGFNIAIVFSGMDIDIEKSNFIEQPYNSNVAPAFDYESIPDFKCLFDFLCNIGYEMSDEEKSLIDGSHELYKPIESEVEE